MIFSPPQFSLCVFYFCCVYVIDAHVGQERLVSDGCARKSNIATTVLVVDRVYSQNFLMITQTYQIGVVLGYFKNKFVLPLRVYRCFSIVAVCLFSATFADRVLIKVHCFDKMQLMSPNVRTNTTYRSKKV